ncbi:MAG: hypothetical protein JKY65_31465 [Planctomycetes bacterium]|nr:hypothetical protein [Planctomycetota bacterium]
MPTFVWVLALVCCLASIALWMFQGIPSATAPRGTFPGELWRAFCLSSAPMVFVGIAVASQPDLVGEGQLKFLLVSSPVATVGSAMALCFFSALGFRLAFARVSPYSPEQREGKRSYRCPLGGFEFLYPKTWKVKRMGTLTFTFAAKPVLGVLRLSRIYSDSASSLVREFQELVLHAGIEEEDVVASAAAQEAGAPQPGREGVRVRVSEVDEGKWPDLPNEVASRVWILDRTRLHFLLEYLHPVGADVAAELHWIEELVQSLDVVQATPRPG